MAKQVISANRLNDGIVVYLTGNDGWSERIADARIVDGEDDGNAALATAKADIEARIIVDPYLVDIDESGGTPQPTRFRELIRAKGPTVRPDLGKQAGQ